MPFSLLVLDASEPRQTGMDIWRESGDRLAVLMPETFIHTPTHISVVQSSELSQLPAVRLSQNLLHTSIVGILEPPWFPIIPLGQGQASRRQAGRLCVLANAHPPRGRMGRQKKRQKKRAQSSVQRTIQHGSLPYLHLCLSLLPRRVCVSSSHVCRLVPVLTAGLEILSKSHRLSSVWNREVLLGGQTDYETTCCL